MSSQTSQDVQAVDFYVPSWDDETSSVGRVDPDELEEYIALAQKSTTSPSESCHSRRAHCAGMQYCPWRHLTSREVVAFGVTRLP